MAPSDPINPPELPAASHPKIRSRPDPVGRGALTNEVMTANLEEDVLQLQNAARSGARWFYWVAALSLVNSVAFLFKGGVSFLAGLAVSQILDGVAANLGHFGWCFDLGLDLVIAFFVCGFGYLAARGSKAALVAGMILYALDGLIFLLFSAILPALFHAFVLFRMWQGWTARRQLGELVAGSPALQSRLAQERTRPDA